MFARAIAWRRSLSAGQLTASSLLDGASGTTNIAFWCDARNWRARLYSRHAVSTST